MPGARTWWRARRATTRTAWTLLSIFTFANPLRAEDLDAGAAPEEPPVGPAGRGRAGAVIVAPPTQEPPAAKLPVTLELPKLLKDEGAEYPSGALSRGLRETFTVDLLLVIDIHGAVSKKSIEKTSGDPEFDQAAMEAASGLLFEPGRAGGKPVAAKIRHRYVFSPPQGRIVGTVGEAKKDVPPLPGAKLTLQGPDGFRREALAGADGKYEFLNVPPGKYRLVVEADGRKTIENVDLDVEPGQEIRIVFQMKRGGGKDIGEMPPPAEGIEEVRVVGVRPAREVTRRTLEQRELSRIPGTNGDALRSIQYLPGVARPPGLFGLLIVRGSNPQDTNVFVDGTLVPLVYHFGGLSSVVPTEMLERIDFYPGNFSSQYGRVMGGIVDVGVRDPKKDRIHGMGQVDLIDARALAEGPIGKTGWAFAIAGRRSYVDVWLKPVLEKAGAGVTTAPVYYDYQLTLQRDFDKRSNFRVMFFGSDDRIEILTRSVSASNPGLGGGVSAHTGFWRLQGRYKNRFSNETELKITPAVGQDFIDFELGDNLFRVNTFPISTRVELTQKIHQGLFANVGMDLLYSPYEVRVRAPPIPRPGEPAGGPFLSRPPLQINETDAIYRPGIYTEFEITPHPGTRLVPGIRADYSKDTRNWDLSPRLVARQEIIRTFPKTALKGGIGQFHQPPQPQETNAVFGQSGLRSNRATHYSVGVEQDITTQIQASLEGFYKQLDYLVTQRAHNEGRGRAYGIETLIRYKPDARFFGWLAYTLSRSERQDTAEDPVRLMPFSQTHILTLLGSYRLGRGWEIGGTFRLVSGNLYTPQSYGFYDENAGTYLALQGYPSYSERLPMFHQLNVRIDKTWRFKDWSLGAYLDVYNAYNSANVEGISRNYNRTREAYASGLPFLPSLGLRGDF